MNDLNMIDISAKVNADVNGGYGKKVIGSFKKVEDAQELINILIKTGSSSKDITITHLKTDTYKTADEMTDELYRKLK